MQLCGWQDAAGARAERQLNSQFPAAAALLDERRKAMWMETKQPAVGGKRESLVGNKHFSIKKWLLPPFRSDVCLYCCTFIVPSRVLPREHVKNDEISTIGEGAKKRAQRYFIFK
jgi:hypothetical protein